MNYKRFLTQVCVVVQEDASSGAYSNTTEDLYDVTIFNSTGWAVGPRTTLTASSDSGITWTVLEAVYPPELLSADDFRAVSFASNSVGWVVASRRQLLYTDDGGLSWTGQAHPFSSKEGAEVHDIEAVSELDAWAVGDWGTVLRTENGGATWLDVSSKYMNHLYGISLLTRAYAFVCGEYGMVLQTSNWGKTWRRVLSPTPNHLYGIYGNVMWRPETGRQSVYAWAVGAQGVIISNAGHDARGGNWTFQPSCTSDDLHDVMMAGAEGFAVGDFGAMCYTTSGGDVWNTDFEAFITPGIHLLGLDFDGTGAEGDWPPAGLWAVGTKGDAPK
ncbi:hypothetical protein CYMTET_22849, partial [Cymbomonas tetramitiformis]